MTNSMLLYRGIIFGSLGVGYFLYRKMLAATMINHNLLLNQTQTNDLYNRNYAQGANNAIIAGHAVNRQEQINSRRKVLIIGAGVIGIAQSLKLLQNGYSVILVDKDNDIAQQASYFNGCVYVPHSVKTMIHRSNMWLMIKNLFKNPEETTLRFNFNSFFEKYFMIWSFNALLSTFSNSKVQELVNHQLLLGKTNETEVQKLKQTTTLFEGQMQCKHLLGLYNSQESKDSMIKSLDKYDIKHSESPQLPEILTNQLPYSIKFDVGSNIDTRKLCEDMIDYCIENFYGYFHIATNTNVRGFAIEPNGKVIGAMTSQGIILADYFVIAAAHKTKYLADRLGIRVPIMPVKGWALGIDLPDTQFFKDHTFSTPQYFSTFIGNQIRLSCGAEISSDFSTEMPSEEWGSKMGLNSFNKHFGLNIKMEDCTVRNCYRPITPDDIPIISPVPTFDNVFITAGHGSKGMTYCFGSAEIMYQIISGSTKYPQFHLNRFWLI